jgi:hypothetical protein
MRERAVGPRRVGLGTRVVIAAIKVSFATNCSLGRRFQLPGIGRHQSGPSAPAGVVVNLAAAEFQQPAGQPNGTTS